MKFITLSFAVLLVFPFFLLVHGQEKHYVAGVNQMTWLGHNGQNFAHSMDVEISGDRAYVSVGFPYGIETYDISNPANPIRLDRQGPAAWGARVYGDKLYVFNRQKGFNIYDISGSIPSELGDYDPTEPHTLYENGALDGDTLYVAAHQKGLYSFDVANPGNPYLLNNITLAENDCWDVEVYDSHLLVANGHFGLSIVELTTSPSEVAVLPLPGLANHILLDGDVAVLSLGLEGIATVDVSSPANPVLLDRVPSGGNAFGFGIANHEVAVGSWSLLEVFDISDPLHIGKRSGENTKTWAMGADIKPFGQEGLVVVADWRGMSTYLTAPDDAPDIDVSPQHLDFGEVSAFETASVKVKNAGTSHLNVNIVNNHSDLAVHPAVFTLAPGAFRSVRVRAKGPGALNGSLLYYSNDPDESPVTQYVYKNNVSFPQVDSKAPEFVLKDPEGYWHYLSDYIGKVIYLEFGGLW